MSGTKKEKIFLIDGLAFCYRAYYAITYLSTSNGMPTNAIYGVVNMLHKLIDDNKPDFMAVAFDMEGPTVRHEKYENYKIDRPPMPLDMVSQLEHIREVINAHNIPIYELEGYEADDIIATLAVKAEKKGYEVVIVTSDKDAFQLINKNIKVLSSHMNESKLYDSEAVKEKYGVAPEKMTELMAFMGDSIDNIPGVKGIGKVTAAKLISDFGTLEGVYKNIKNIKSKALQDKLNSSKDDAIMSRSLALLNKDLPVDLDMGKMRSKDPDMDALTGLYKKFEFNKLLKGIAPRVKADYKFSRCESVKDVEKTADSARKAGMAAISLYTEADSLKAVALTAVGHEPQLIELSENDPNKDKKVRIIKEIIEDETIEKIGYDFKKDIIILRRMGMSPAGFGFDIMIADYLIDPSRSSREIENIAENYLGKAFTVALEPGGDIAAVKCGIFMSLYPAVSEKIKKIGLQDLFNNLEMPLVYVLAAMEEEGMAIDLEFIARMSKDIDKKLDEKTGRIYSLAGGEFNINSPKQLQHVLFDILNLHPVKKTKTGVSTDESVLTKLAGVHDLPKELLEYRSISKLKNTYYDVINDMTDKKTKRLHTHFNQAVAATGRLSSSDPNLQNVPVRTAMGKEIRRAFIAGQDKRILISADYSQIELRVLAHLSGDKNLIKAFKSGEDIHIFTACLIFGVKKEDVTDKMRSVAKTVNFGIVYGMGPFRLANDLGIDFQEANAFISSYFERYPGVRDFMDETIKKAKKDGFVTTLLNRRRYFPELLSGNDKIRSFAERAAINTPVQGTAADIIKMAMLKCFNKFGQKDVRMTLQVHDELIFTAPKNNLKEAANEIKSLMEGVIKLEVPLMVNIEAGCNWLETEEVAF